MIAVVSPAADENVFTGIVPQEGILQCLISQTVDVKSGQSATVVITATTRNDVLILPLSVIAGRQGTIARLRIVRHQRIEKLVAAVRCVQVEVHAQPEVTHAEVEERPFVAVPAVGGISLGIRQQVLGRRTGRREPTARARSHF